MIAFKIRPIEYKHWSPEGIVTNANTMSSLFPWSVRALGDRA